MKRLRLHNNERGLTLVEILASLVILGIVFVGFMTVFPQMTNFNEKTMTKLSTMNDARTILADMKRKEPYSNTYFSNSDYIETADAWVLKNEKLEITVYKKVELNPKGEEHERDSQYILRKIEIVVLDKGKQSSETFGLIQMRYK